MHIYALLTCYFDPKRRIYFPSGSQKSASNINVLTIESARILVEFDEELNSKKKQMKVALKILMDQGRSLIKNISQQIGKSSYYESATRECIMLELYLSTPKCQLDWYFKFLFLTRFNFDIHYTTPYPKRAKKQQGFG